MYFKRELFGEKFFSLCLYGLFALLMILAIANKRNFYSDEISSYKWANYDMTKPVFEDGRVYYPSGSAWSGFMTVANEDRFSYGNVWKNQAKDVHPPLYYAILHTICSVFPGCFSIWFAGVINILSAMGTLFFVRKLVLLLTGDEKMKRLVSLAFIVSAGILSAVTFLRMYILAMLEVTALTYLLLKKIGGGAGKQGKFHVELFVCMVCGALTHYYFILYAALISMAYVILLLRRKDWRETWEFCLMQVLAGAVSIGIFPAMLFHIFAGYRGRESFGNLADSISINGIDRISTFLDKLNEQLFGSIFTYVAVFMVICLVVCGREECRNDSPDKERRTGEKYFCLFFAGIFYFLIVAFSTSYLEDRYMFPIYAVVFLAVLCLLGEWMKKRSVRYLYGMIFITAVISVHGLKNAEWNYLYKSTETLLDVAREHAGTDCLFIYDKSWHMQSAYCEAREYHSVAFLREENLETLSTMDFASRYELIVIVDGRDQDILNQIMDICPFLNTCEHLGGFSGNNTYYLYAGREE